MSDYNLGESRTKTEDDHLSDEPHKGVNENRMPMVMQAKPINHQRVKSPIVHIDLRSCKEETKHSRYAVDNTSGEEEEEDNIASMPEIINDSMMGELNMLISDLNNGKNKSSGR